MLANMQIGPRLISYGEGWRIEEYHESVVLLCSSLPNPSIFCQVASQLARLHKIHRLTTFPHKLFDSYTSVTEPVCLLRLDKWTLEAQATLQRLDDDGSIQKTSKLKKLIQDFPSIVAAVEKLKAKLTRGLQSGKAGWDVVSSNIESVFISTYSIHIGIYIGILSWRCSRE